MVARQSKLFLDYLDPNLCLSNFIAEAVSIVPSFGAEALRINPKAVSKVHLDGIPISAFHSDFISNLKYETNQ